MSSFGSNTGPQSGPPLLDGVIDDALFQLRPDGDEALLQIIDVTAYRDHFYSNPYSGTL